MEIKTLLKTLAIINLSAFVIVLIEPYDGAWDGLWMLLGIAEMTFSIWGLIKLNK